MRDVSGRTAFITGAAGGIGLGMARAFIAAGMRVAIADINADKLAAAAESLRATGAEVCPVVLDITSPAAWAHALEAAEAALGPISVLCNNAGIGQGRFPDGRPIELAEMPEALWHLVIDINVHGTFNGIRAAAPRMKAQGGGHIVNTASMAGLVSPGGLGAYCASKYAVVGLSEALRAELAPHNIGVSVLCPGGVRTDFVASSAERRAATPGAEEGMAQPLATRADPAPRMDPLNVGHRVLAAIRNDDFYIITHPEYRGLVDERIAAITAAFGPSAQPGYIDPPIVTDRSRNPEYARAAARGQEPSHG